MAVEKDEEAVADEDRDKRSTIGVQWEVGIEQLVVCGAGHKRLWWLMGGGFRDRKKKR